MARTQRTDSGIYNRPAQVQAPAAYVDDGEGGNSNANVWNTVRSPRVALQSATSPRYIFHRLYQYGQLYPEASHFALMRYAGSTTIDATMRLVVNNRAYQIIGVEDVNLEHVTTLLVLIEYQAQGSKQ